MRIPLHDADHVCQAPDMETNMITDLARAAADAADFGEATARKTGHNPAWPYVPVIAQNGRHAQIMGLAFATREEAIAAAEGHILRLRHNLAGQLAQPQYRALREQHGLPREIAR